MTYLDLDVEDLTRVKYIHDKPLLDFGQPGTFDEHGIMPSSVVEHDGEIFLYYSGWQKSVGVPYNNYTGLAISTDGGATFEKYSEAPIIDRNNNELFSATSPCVVKDGDDWHMWYCSGTGWHEIDGKFEHTYDIKYASAVDGKSWYQTGIVSIPQQDKYEAITRPTVIKLDGIYHMWFCYRGSEDFRGGKDSYRIGYATSKNLRNWTRDDKNSGIDVSKTGWDSNMIAYPSVTNIYDKIIMVYNGNDFGIEGFGYAILKNN